EADAAVPLHAGSQFRQPGAVSERRGSRRGGTGMNAWVDCAGKGSVLALLAGGVALGPVGQGEAAPAPAGAGEKAGLQKQLRQLQGEYDAAYQKGELVRATKLAKDALEIALLLYPEKDYPNGHTDLATGLNDVAYLLKEQGEPGEARKYYERALK